MSIRKSLAAATVLLACIACSGGPRAQQNEQIGASEQALCPTIYMASTNNGTSITETDRPLSNLEMGGLPPNNDKCKPPTFSCLNSQGLPDKQQCCSKVSLLNAGWLGQFDEAMVNGTTCSLSWFDDTYRCDYF